MMKKNLLDHTEEELSGIVTGLGGKKFRARQIYGWLAKGAASFDEMSNVPLSLRNALAEDGYYIGQPEVVTEQISKTDGTRKCLYEFRDGARVVTGRLPHGVHILCKHDGRQTPGSYRR